MLVVNINNLRSEPPPNLVYIGRGNSKWPKSPLGNPFSHLLSSSAAHIVSSREESIECFRRALIGVFIKKSLIVVPISGVLTEIVNPLFRDVVLKELSQLHEDCLLGCHCKPLPCHGDVIVRGWSWGKDNKYF